MEKYHIKINQRKIKIWTCSFYITYAVVFILNIFLTISLQLRSYLDLILMLIFFGGIFFMSKKFSKYPLQISLYDDRIVINRYVTVWSSEDSSYYGYRANVEMSEDEGWIHLVDETKNFSTKFKHSEISDADYEKLNEFLSK
ncbi:MAG: hypothetical protein MJZ52_04940 [Bacteroidales bacterium]|nr:hypothetical protein [Bacteroidales bacterium]